MIDILIFLLLNTRLFISILMFYRKWNICISYFCLICKGQFLFFYNYFIFEIWFKDDFSFGIHDSVITNSCKYLSAIISICNSDRTRVFSFGKINGNVCLLLIFYYILNIISFFIT